LPPLVPLVLVLVVVVLVLVLVVVVAWASAATSAWKCSGERVWRAGSSCRVLELQPLS
jgi:hypothetical protein